LDSAEADTQNGTVLVVEDEDMLRLPVTRMLRRKGFSVMEATDGPSAVKLYRAHHNGIDVVLLDMTLPGMGGREVLAELRRTCPDVSVILTTAYSQEDAFLNVNVPEALGFVRKPYELGNLIQILRAACRPKKIRAAGSRITELS
jgi:CheY-like chemotaxis protein